MELSFKETKLYHFSPGFWHTSLLIIVSVAFLLSDWSILYSSFGDFILAFSVFLLLLIGKIKLTYTQLLTMGTILILLILTLVLNYFFNAYWFNTFRAFISSVKLIFYLISTILLYNFVTSAKLEEKLLKVSTNFALFAIILGVLITFAIVLGLDNIYNIIWTFTRSDSRSYFFGIRTDIIRTRSLFSEPAHLGYYLNIVFFANVFHNAKNNIVVLVLLGLGILLTLSYSMIFIFIITGITVIFIRLIKSELSWSKWYWLISLPIAFTLYYYWDFINVTIIERTLSIFSGDDGSANVRLLGSWTYVERERLLFGNGIGHTPPITNIYAYILSDFGLIGFMPYIGLTFYLLIKHLPGFVLFVLLNSAKGGYLNPLFWMLIMFIFLYGINKKSK